MEMELASGVNPACAQSALNLRASRTSRDGGKGWGGRQR